MKNRLLVLLLALSAGASAREVNIRVLATTDLHGNIYAWDYFTGREVPRGLAKISTLIAAERAGNPNTLLIDCGDTIQGAPLEGVYQHFVRTGSFPSKITPVAPLTVDPMMLAMNALHYDVMTIGNHEWNFGLKNLNAARSAAHFPWISANIGTTTGSTAKPFEPWFIKVVDGVKIAIIGITTPGEPTWETPDHYTGYRFLQGKAAAARAVADVKQKEHPDVVIIAAHAGLEKEVKNGVITNEDTRFDNLPGENMVHEIATQVPGIDAIIFGHTHSELAGARLGDVLLMQPRNWGMSLGEMDFKLDSGADGHWRVLSKNSRVIPVTNKTASDEAILQMAKPYHETAELYLNTPVTQSPVAMDAAVARVQDSPMIDMVQQVQLHYAKADVSFASILNGGLKIAQGPMTIRQIAGLYIYDNTLYAIEGDGKMVRAALENAARYYRTCTGDCTTGPLINPDMISYNYDMAAGVEYEIDLRQPEGHRIQNLRYHGKPLEDSQKLRIAVNNYRSGGGAGYLMFRDAKVVWRSTEEIRELMIDYFSGGKPVPAKAVGNWKVIPEAAEAELIRETSREGPRLK